MTGPNGDGLDVEYAGDEEPETPSRDAIADLLDASDDELDGDEQRYYLRASLDHRNPDSAARNVVKALEDKITVLSSSIHVETVTPVDAVDALVAASHDPGKIASALSEAKMVSGVLVADISDIVEDEPVDANDVFAELKRSTEPVGYDEMVDELKDVEFPGGPDPDEEIDLEDEVAELRSNGEPEGVTASDESTEPDAEATGDVDDFDASAEELFGEQDRDDEAVAADEEAISKAVEEVELADPTADESDEDAEETESEPKAEPQTGAEVDSQPESEPGVAEAAEPAESDDEEPEAGTAIDDEIPEVNQEPADGAITEPTNEAAAVDPDAVVAAFVEAVENDALSDSQQQTLREALGAEGADSIDVRLEYLQKRVDKLAAYTDAWEEFLDDHGRGREFMESVEEEVQALEAEVEALKEEGMTADAGSLVTEEAIDDLEGRVDDLEDVRDDVDHLANVREDDGDDLEALQNRFESVEESVESVEASVEEVEASVEEVETEVSAVAAAVDRLESWREHVIDVFGSITASLGGEHEAGTDFESEDDTDSESDFDSDEETTDFDTDEESSDFDTDSESDFDTDSESGGGIDFESDDSRDASSETSTEPTSDPDTGDEGRRWSGAGDDDGDDNDESGPSVDADESDDEDGPVDGPGVSDGDDLF